MNRFLMFFLSPSLFKLLEVILLTSWHGARTRKEGKRSLIQKPLVVGGVWDSFYLFVKGVKEDEVKRRGKKRLEGGFLFCKRQEGRKKTDISW